MNEKDESTVDLKQEREKKRPHMSCANDDVHERWPSMKLIVLMHVMCVLLLLLLCYANILIVLLLFALFSFLCCCMNVTLRWWLHTRGLVANGNEEEEEETDELDALREWVVSLRKCERMRTECWDARWREKKGTRGEEEVGDDDEEEEEVGVADAALNVSANDGDEAGENAEEAAEEGDDSTDSARDSTVVSWAVVVVDCNSASAECECTIDAWGVRESVLAEWGGVEWVDGTGKGDTMRLKLNTQHEKGEKNKDKENEKRGTYKTKSLHGRASGCVLWPEI